MKKIVTIVVLTSCLLCTGCGTASADSQNTATGSVSADFITIQDTRSEFQLEPVSSGGISSDESGLSAALEKLVLDYQSGDWGGWVRSILNGRYLAEVHGDYIMLHACDGGLDLWTLSLVNVNLPVGRSVFDFVDSGAFIDPNGEERTYWLSEDGVYCYDLGEEIASWPISGVERGQAFLTQYEDYAPCIQVDHQIIYCAPGGATTVLTEDAE